MPGWMIFFSDKKTRSSNVWRVRPKMTKNDNVVNIYFGEFLVWSEYFIDHSLYIK